MASPQQHPRSTSPQHQSQNARLSTLLLPIPMSVDHNQAVTRLQQIRPELLKLHKALLYSERAVYEQTHGPIANSGEFFRLVTEDDAFNWLRPISKFIVQIDELLDLRKKDTVEPESAAILLEKARLMLKPNKDSLTPLGERYFTAIQRDPNIALMHADISQKLREKGAANP